MSRPQKSEPRCKQLNLSLTEREFADIETRAAALGMRAVHFSRALLFETGRRSKTTSKRRLQAQKERDNHYRLIHSQHVRLGNNLNQIARHANTVGGPVPPDLEPLLNDVRAII